ncbi:hypothetical protein [Actinoallomurus sp. CA-142502]|uniref:hypothetical protein n=1 Tax=Actinoallomurus sp. CA-142502 TaxID=3239885 RepID=UPI003D8FC15D
MTRTTATRPGPKRLIIVIAAAIVTTLTAGITAASAAPAHAAVLSVAGEGDSQAGSAAVNPADIQMPASINFDRTCYTFAGDTEESCGIRLDRGTSEALFNAAKGVAVGAFNLVCVPLLTPFVGHDSATLTCTGIAAYATSWAKLPDGQTFWIGTSGPKMAHIYLVDADAAMTGSAPSAARLVA